MLLALHCGCNYGSDLDLPDDPGRFQAFPVHFKTFLENVSLFINFEREKVHVSE